MDWRYLEDVSSSPKTKSCWPLLGHWTDYPANLTHILEIIDTATSAENANKELVDAGMARNRSQALKLQSYLVGMGLLSRSKNGHFRLSAASVEYLGNRDKTIIRRALRENLAWVEEIESILSGQQLVISHLTERLREEYGVPWRSNWQVRFRLNWMRAFGMVERLSEVRSIGRYPEWKLVTE